MRSRWCATPSTARSSRFPRRSRSQRRSRSSCLRFWPTIPATARWRGAAARREKPDDVETHPCRGLDDAPRVSDPRPGAAETGPGLALRPAQGADDQRRRRVERARPRRGRRVEQGLRGGGACPKARLASHQPRGGGSADRNLRQGRHPRQSAAPHARFRGRARADQHRARSRPARHRALCPRPAPPRRPGSGRERPDQRREGLARCGDHRGQPRAREPIRLGQAHLRGAQPSLDVCLRNAGASRAASVRDRPPAPGAFAVTRLSRRQALAGGGVTALAAAAAAAPEATAQACRPEPTTITVDAGRVLGPLPKFWRCTGFTPAELLLLPEMRQTLSFLGAVPNRGLEFVRVHYLLDLIVATRGGGRIAYDWTLLDEALETMLERGLRPFLELMGNPSGLFDDFEDMDQLRAWRDLVAELASRCV